MAATRSGSSRALTQRTRLGLSDQVPAKIVILTDGVPRRVSLGKLTLVFRRAAPRNLFGRVAKRRTGDSGIALSAHQPGHFAACRAIEENFGRGNEADLESLAPKT